MKVRSVGVRRVWDCMLCPCVSEEGGDGEGVDLEVSSLPSYTLRYVSLVELGTLSRGGVPRTDPPVWIYGQGGGSGLRSAISAVIHT